MIGVVIAALMLAVLVWVTRATTQEGRDHHIARALIAGYLLRITVSLFSRDFAFFSHGGGGDYLLYESWAVEIARFWQFTGLEFLTKDEIPQLGQTSLPPNLFAFVVTLNGGDPTPLGCTAIVACVACLSCLNLYLLALELGADQRKSSLVMIVLLFSPAYVLYSSDMYKDGLVVFAVTTALGSSFRLARKFSIRHLVIGGLALWALWYIRYYLVFVAVAPLFVGITGVRAKSSARPLIAVMLLAAGFVIAMGSTDVLDTVSERATETFQYGTSRDVKAGNAQGGSGVTFDDGGNPLGALGPKLAYQLFAPFPWTNGSVGYHIGKIDAFIYYYLMYRAWQAVRRLWKTERGAVLMHLTFIVPTTIVYATSFANVGLSLRQRIILVMMTGLLATLSWPAETVAADEKPRMPPELGPPRPAFAGTTGRDAPLAIDMAVKDAMRRHLE